MILYENIILKKYTQFFLNQFWTSCFNIFFSEADRILSVRWRGSKKKAIW